MCSHTWLPVPELPRVSKLGNTSGQTNDRWDTSNSLGKGAKKDRRKTWLGLYRYQPFLLSVNCSLDISIIYSMADKLVSLKEVDYFFAKIISCQKNFSPKIGEGSHLLKMSSVVTVCNGRDEFLGRAPSLTPLASISSPQNKGSGARCHVRTDAIRFTALLGT